MDAPLLQHVKNAHFHFISLISTMNHKDITLFDWWEWQPQCFSIFLLWDEPWICLVSQLSKILSWCFFIYLWIKARLSIPECFQSALGILQFSSKKHCAKVTKMIVVQVQFLQMDGVGCQGWGQRRTSFFCYLTARQTVNAHTKGNVMLYCIWQKGHKKGPNMLHWFPIIAYCLDVWIPDFLYLLCLTFTVHSNCLFWLARFLTDRRHPEVSGWQMFQILIKGASLLPSA